MQGGTVWIAVAIGGAVGAVARFAVSKLSVFLLGPHFPWGTLAANVSGSFCMGLALAWFAKYDPQQAALKAFVTIGILGAFTTFSTFSLDVVTLYKERTVMVAGAYVVASLVLSLGGLLAGLSVERHVL